MVVELGNKLMVIFKIITILEERKIHLFLLMAQINFLFLIKIGGNTIILNGDKFKI
jgi:hypothetical protein